MKEFEKSVRCLLQKDVRASQRIAKQVTQTLFFFSIAKATNLGVMGHANCMGHNSF